MSKSLLSLFASLLVSFSFGQTISDFESFSLAPDSFLNGSAQPLGTVYSDGHADFTNYYDTAFGGFWSGGWAISTMRDDTTAGFANLYSAYPASGANATLTYAVGQQGSRIHLTGNAQGGVVSGLYITNSTFAYLSMLNGDGFAKQFGGPTGNDPDFFKLTISGWYNGNPLDSSVDFYLADYRFTDNTQDYIVDDWQWVDLTSLGNVDSLSFQLFSSDTGQFGINTPTFFCIDQLTTADSKVSLAENQTIDISIYPNPAQDQIRIESEVKIQSYEIVNTVGITVLKGEDLISGTAINISQLPAGRYFFRTDKTIFYTFVKY